jgi:excinuclease ABC subunit C
MAENSDQKTISDQTLFEALIQQAQHSPTGPGVYVMRNMQGRILYVGKARNLRNRLKSYFNKSKPDNQKTRILLNQIARFETTLTHTEKEALILESNLIKRHRPRYNVVLKDDKRYPSLRLNISHPYPNLNVVRKIKNDAALYFGPYSSAAAVRQTLKFIHKTFKLRKCHSRTFMNRSRPCLNYQMGLCLAPCCLKVDQAQYDEIVKEVTAFLKGRTPHLIRKVRRQMDKASQSQEFEKAAVLRDKIHSLERTLEKQVSVTTDFKNRDAIGCVQEDEILAISVLQVRSGYLMGKRNFRFRQTIGNLAEQLGLFIRQYYERSQDIPSEILMSELPDGHELLRSFLSEKRSAKVLISVPQRGEKRRLIEMAVQNAQLELDAFVNSENEQLEVLTRLRERLGLKRMPHRIECFDNSNFQGTLPVSGMVVFENAQPSPSDYRHYKVQPLDQPDDYAHMAEVVRRRYGKGDGSAPFPDLLLVDGGKGQLSSALSVLTELAVDHLFDVAAIAKKDPDKGEPHDKVYLAGRVNAVQFGRDTDLLLLLQRIRDEAHRWAITFQRKRRQKFALQSELDAIPGIGPMRRAALFKKFGHIKGIRSASLEDLESVGGISANLAKQIQKYLN